MSKMNTNENQWTSECPTEPGEYEFSCDGRSRRVVSKILIRDLGGSLHAKCFAHKSIPVKEWWQALRNPQWRRHLGGIEPPMSDEEFRQPHDEVMGETPETDAMEMESKDWPTGDQFDEARRLCRSLETRLAAAERALKDARKVDMEWEKAHRLAIEERNIAHGEIWKVRAERDAWKGIAGRLNVYAQHLCPWGKSTPNACTCGLTDKRAELNKLREGGK